MAVFFWLVASVAALPAIGFTVLSARLGGLKTMSRRGGLTAVVLIYLAVGWPMFMMGTQYRAVSTVRFADKYGVSLRGAEFLQDTALVAFSVTFISFFSMYVFHFTHKKLGCRAALLFSVLYLVVEIVVFVLVGRSVGAGYW